MTTVLALFAGCAAAPPAKPAEPHSTASGPQADVPWAALDPTYPAIPRRRVSPVPDPAEARAAPPCRASGLRFTADAGGAGGTFYLSFVVRAAGSRACRLEGRPRVTLLEHGRPVDVPVAPTRGDDLMFNYPDPVLVAPGRVALLTLGWATDWCTTPVDTDQVRLELPDGGGAVTVRGFGRSPGCTMRVQDLSPAERHTTPVRVSTFAPRRSRPARLVSAYAGLDARARRTSAPQPGRPLDFVVVLTARRDVVLDPCPDFTIRQYEMDRSSSEDRYALNCAAVATKDAQGRPYLPAGDPVRFAMRTELLGDVGPLKFLWELEVPEAPAAGLVLSAGE